MLLAGGPDVQAIPGDGTSPRRDEELQAEGDRGHLCLVAETPDEATSTVDISPSLVEASRVDTPV